MTKEGEPRNNPIFAPRSEVELPEEIELPQVVFDEAIRLTNLTRADGKEYLTTFQYQNDQLVQGKVYRGSEKSVRRGKTVKLLRSLFSHTMTPTLELHTHPGFRYSSSEELAKKVKVKIKSNRPVSPGLEELVRYVLADQDYRANDWVGLPSARDVTNFLASNLSASLVASEGSMVLMVKNRLVTFKEKLANDYDGHISRKMWEYHMALRAPSVSYLDVWTRLTASLDPFAVCYRSNPDVTPTLTRLNLSQ